MKTKENKGLADNQEGEFILNESGTSVSTDHTDEKDRPIIKEVEEGKTAVSKE